VSRWQRRGGGGDSRGLEADKFVFPIRWSLCRQRLEPPGKTEKGGGGGGRGSYRGPTANQDATRALPPPQPPSARPSDVCCVLHRLCHSCTCPLRPISTTCRIVVALTAREPACAHYHLTGSARDSHEFVVDTVDFATTGEEGGGAGAPGLLGCHSHPATRMPPPPSPTTRWRWCRWRGARSGGGGRGRSFRGCLLHLATHTPTTPDRRCAYP
jgi:hypothetical protein